MAMFNTAERYIETADRCLGDGTALLSVYGRLGKFFEKIIEVETSVYKLSYRMRGPTFANLESDDYELVSVALQNLIEVINAGMDEYRAPFDDRMDMLGKCANNLAAVFEAVPCSDGSPELVEQMGSLRGRWEDTRMQLAEYRQACEDGLRYFEAFVASEFYDSSSPNFPSSPQGIGEFAASMRENQRRAAIDSAKKNMYRYMLALGGLTTSQLARIGLEVTGAPAYFDRPPSSAAEVADEILRVNSPGFKFDAVACYPDPGVDQTPKRHFFMPLKRRHHPHPRRL